MPNNSLLRWQLQTSFAQRPLHVPGPVLPGLKISAGGRSTTNEYEGLVDTGADVCVIPEEIADELGLTFLESEEMAARGAFDAQPQRRRVYFVKLLHAELGEAPICAMLRPRNTILIGRDFLAGIDVVKAAPSGAPKRVLTLDFGSNMWGLKACN